MRYQREKQVAVEAVTLAAQLCQRVRQTIQPEAIEKRDRSPVTIADFGSQAIICKLLSEAFPADQIVAEEDATALTQPEMKNYLGQVTDHVQEILSAATPEQVVDWINRGNGRVNNRYWTLDPIDGTKGFLRGEQYAVALALIEEGEVKVGVLACPALTLGALSPNTTDDADAAGTLFVAVRQQGATVTSLGKDEARPIRVIDLEDVDDIDVETANFRLVESVESGHGNHTQQDLVAKAVGITAPPLQMDSQAKYAVVACGQAALYLRLPSPKTPDYREKIWDHAAGVIVVEEAGGKVTDMHGQPLNFALDYQLTANQGVVVSNGRCHDAVLAALK